MSNQTLRRPPAKASRQKPARGGQGAKKSTRYSRQTARIGIETRRDGKPLIFGWGRHLSRLQKHRIQNRAAYTFGGVVIASVLAVVVFAVIQQNILIPNQSIVSVNGTGITQDTYRKELAYKSQVEWNVIQKMLIQQQAAAKKADAGDATAVQQNQGLISQIQAEESNYTQASLTQSAVDALTNDQLIQAGERQFETQDHVKASTFTPTSGAVTKALNDFKHAFPSGETYSQFVSADSLSEDDMRAAIMVDLRSSMMKNYLQSLLVSPIKQVHLRRIQLDTLQHANTVRAELVKDTSDTNWLKLAKQQSLDPTTKTVGGDMGWLFQGESDNIVLNWAFGAHVKVGDISPVLKDTTGTYDIVQLRGIDPSRVVDPSQLSAARDNALDHWLTGQKALPSGHITTADSTMMSAARSLPKLPNLNATLPNFNPRQSNPTLGG